MIKIVNNEESSLRDYPNYITDLFPSAIKSIILDGSMVLLEKSSDLLKSKDLSLSVLDSKKSKSKFLQRAKRDPTLIRVNDNIAAFSSDSFQQKYFEALFQAQDGFSSISVDNFLFNNENKLLVSKDYRIIVKDNGSGIPKSVLYHVATLGMFGASGLVNLEEVISYVNLLLGKYGYTHYRYQFRGFLSIEIGNDKPGIDFSSRLSISNSIHDISSSKF